MKLSVPSFLCVTSFSTFANAQQAAWGQCGGIGWAGATSCTTGYICRSQNPYYSQCLRGYETANPSSTKTSPSTKSITSTTILTTTKTSSSQNSTQSSAATTSSAAPTNTGIEYVISFGDSYSQTGFDPSLTLASDSNPLGNPTFPGWTTSGGPNWIGYYITQFNNSLTYSCNYASGGATTDSKLIQPFAPTVLSFVEQVERYLTNTKKQGFVKWNANNSLFAVWIGVNDVGNAWSWPNYTALLGQIMDQYMNQTQTLYNSGARRFVFLNVPPIQLSPTVLAQGDATVKAEAAGVKQYNDALKSRVATFANLNPTAKTYLVDTTTPFLKAIQEPQAYGADNATCFDASGTKCLWWNDYHPGLAIHKLVAEAVAEAVKGS